MHTVDLEAHGIPEWVGVQAQALRRATQIVSGHSNDDQKDDGPSGGKEFKPPGLALYKTPYDHKSGVTMACFS